jgi:hypothetical protein
MTLNTRIQEEPLATKAETAAPLSNAAVRLMERFYRW